MQTPGWWDKVEGAIAERSMLKHPFYQAWQMGRLSKDDLAHYAKAYYPHVAAFPRYVSATHSNVEELGARQTLLENLVEEEQGPENHPELWLRFAEGLGVDRRDVAGAQIPSETRECVETFLGLARKGGLEGMAALYAYESQIPAVSETKLEGLSKFYGMTDARARKFFEVHKGADVWHSAAEREALVAAARTPEEQERVVAAVKTACDAVNKLLDGVVEARQICTSC